MHDRYHAANRARAVPIRAPDAEGLDSKDYTKRGGCESKRAGAACRARYSASAGRPARAARASSTRRPTSWRRTFDGQWISAAAA